MILYECFQEDPRFFNIMSTLWKHTFAAGIKGFESYFSGFSPSQGYFYIDRVCYRLPDEDTTKHGGLFLHTDCDPRCPGDDPSKWRPIQATVTLTDALTPTSGNHAVFIINVQSCLTIRIHISFRWFICRPRNAYADRRVCKKAGKFSY